MDGWKTTFLLGRELFRGYVKLREGIFYFFASHVGEIAGIETESKWKSIEHHELHHPTNGMFAQAVGRRSDVGS